MARIILNTSIKSFRGQINKEFVVRKVGDQWIASAFPKKSKKKRTEKQKEQNKKFARAAAYAQAVKADPAESARLLSLYKGSQSAYHAAVKDFYAMNAPSKAAQDPESARPQDAHRTKDPQNKKH